MKTITRLAVIPALLIILTASARATEHYVNLNNPTPAPPYTDWSSAATTIQDAVDAADSGDLILVTNGIYQTGGRVATLAGLYGSLLNRVLIDKAVTVQSVNGSSATIIQGYQMPGQTNGVGAVRCVFLTNNAALIGFTLTQGATQVSGYSFDKSGGGAYCRSGVVISNCVFVANAAASSGGGVSGATIFHCTFSGNITTNGGAASSSTLFDCMIISNTAKLNGGAAYNSSLYNCIVATNSAAISGGGTYNSDLTNCIIIENTAKSSGGGAYSGTLTNCNIYGNSAGSGGGVYSAQLSNCTLTNNYAFTNGGGSFSSTLNNCGLTRNSAPYGGGAYQGSLNNCTLTRNLATTYGGGVYGASAKNCVVYYNSAPIEPNFSGSYLNYCCTTPLPLSGTNNITVEPQLVSDFHLAATSECRNAGNTNYVAGVDIDGEPFAKPPSIGCDEFYATTATGTLAVAILSTYTNVVVGHALDFFANVGGLLGMSVWDFGDGNTATNLLFVSHTWDAAGDYSVHLKLYNESNPDGVVTSVLVHVVQEQVYYVAADSIAPLPPYNSWATAAQSIQDAVDAATVIGGLVLVSNGVYNTGGRVVYGTVTNRVAVTKPLALQSVNGPGVTTINGYQIAGVTNGASAVRCVFLTDNAILSGFTIQGGATHSSGDLLLDQSGGGVWCSATSDTISNCVVMNNSAYSSGGGIYSGTLISSSLISNTARIGGGVDSSFLTNCALMGNLALDKGGGAANAILDGCTVLNNGNNGNFFSGFTTLGGGIYNCVGNDCIISNNSASQGGGAYMGSLTASVITSNICDPGFDKYWAGGGGINNVNATNCSLLFNHSGESGGGASGGILDHCLVVSNTVGESTAGSGGGLSGSSAINSVILGNTAVGSSGGGGAAYSSLNECILASNLATVNAPDYGASGGGASVSMLTNCIIKENYAEYGGGVASGSLDNCILFGNKAAYYGGGSAINHYVGYVYNLKLNNCTLVNNSAGIAGGGDYAADYDISALNNCIIYYNSAPTNANCFSDTLSYCCTAQIASGTGNITNEPLFMDMVNGDLRLQSGSPCINAGSNIYAPTDPDLDGAPRIVGGTVDIGAYEFPSPASALSYAWLQQFGLPADGSADYTDSDSDGLNNWQEWQAGTNPTNAASVLQMLSVTATNNPAGNRVTWQSVGGIVYYLQRSTNLATQPAFVTIGNNIVGQAGTTSYTDTSATNASPFFYRVGVQN